MKILVVEDDASMQNSICAGLSKFGYAVDRASDGEEALELFETNQYDAVILDLNLPKLDGIEVLREIRKTDEKLGVLILSARSGVDDKVLGLDAGANDYLAKPFHFKELEARLRVLTRRKFIQPDATLVFGELKVDTALKSAYCAGIKIELTNKEYSILEYLLIHRDAVVSAEELIEHIWDSETGLFSNSLKVHVNSLKKKLAAHIGDTELIKNTRNVGYYIATPQAGDGNE
jgi:DNA-binding response OmpR family regulator